MQEEKLVIIHDTQENKRGVHVNYHSYQEKLTTEKREKKK